MEQCDFFKENKISEKKKKIVNKNREIINDFLQVTFKKGSSSLYYSITHNHSDPLKEFSFLEDDFDFKVQPPKVIESYGISDSKYNSIKSLYNIIPEEKIIFWENLKRKKNE